jgi:ubiquinol-cytochrome c reductase cytochrome b subunit
MPLLGLIETPKRLPNSITEAVLDKHRRKTGDAAQPAAAPGHEA